MKPSKVKKAKNAPGVQGPASSAKKATPGAKSTPANSYQPFVLHNQSATTSSRRSRADADLSSSCLFKYQTEVSKSTLNT
jgi:hypothetical protein